MTNPSEPASPKQISGTPESVSVSEETRYAHLPRRGPLDADTEYDIDVYAVAYCNQLEMAMRDQQVTRNQEALSRARSKAYAALETLRARIRELISESPDAL